MPELPPVSLARMTELLPSALVIAFLAAVESLLSAMVADWMIGGSHRPNAEVLAQGWANIGSALFGGLPAGAPPDLPPLPPFRAFGQTVLPVASPQSAVLFGQDGLAAEDPDWEAAQVALRILAGGGFTSRLMIAVREKRGLAYGIGAGLSVLFRRGVIIGSVATENARVAETLAVTREEWARMAAEGPTEAELDDAVAFCRAHAGSGAAEGEDR